MKDHSSSSERLLVKFQAFDYQEQGLGGMPVHRRFGEIKRLLEHHLDRAHSDLFATPDYGNMGEPVAWNAAGEGRIQYLGDETPVAATCLSAYIEDIYDLIDALNHSELESDRRSAELLSLTLSIPDECFVFAMGDSPRVGGWGYVDPKRGQRDTLRLLATRYRPKAQLAEQADEDDNTYSVVRAKPLIDTNVPEESHGQKLVETQSKRADTLPPPNATSESRRQSVHRSLIIGRARHRQWSLPLFMVVILGLTGLLWDYINHAKTKGVSAISTAPPHLGCWSQRGIENNQANSIVRVVLELCIAKLPSETKMSMYENGKVRCTAPITAVHANNEVRITLNGDPTCQFGAALPAFDVDCTPPVSNAMDCDLRWRGGRVETFSLRQET